MRELPKAYNPQGAEENLYKLWEESGFFAPEAHPPWAGSPETNPNYGKTFTIIMPPTNANGDLHAGHGLVMTLEDIMIRFNRMRGKKTLWLPGNDHAGFETQVVYEKVLEKQGRSRFDIAPEDLYKEIWGFTQNNRSNINSQVKKIGASCDWSREKFTLDRDIVKTVYSTFEKLFEDGLIYRGKKIVSWCPKHQTSFSDLEIVDEERVDKFYYLKYGPFVIGTSRPETKFGDKYVVMHPDDTKYQEYRHGQKIELEWINGKVTATVIKDDSIDMEFGTGVMTITPWHDRTDFEIAERNKLDKEQIIDEKGLLLPIAGEFAGLHIKKARPLIVKKLEQKGLLVKIDEKYTHRVATNSRGGGIIEPQIMKQWFVDVNKEFSFPHAKLQGIKEGERVTLKKLMLHVVQNKEITILPERFEKIYYHWIENLRDWCISRQIWYGHQIPVWYRNENIYVGTQLPKEEGWVRDPDTLDTWFSSGLWTFSTLGWPKETEDFKAYHPTSILETGYDILFFWVARMILMSTYLL